MSPQGALSTTYPGPKVREQRLADAEPPAGLPLLSLPQREMLLRWARPDSVTRQWLPLLRSEAAHASIEEVEALATLLLNHGRPAGEERLAAAIHHLAAPAGLEGAAGPGHRRIPPRRAQPAAAGPG